MSFKEYASKSFVLEKLSSLGGGVSSWNDLTDKPFEVSYVYEWIDGFDYQETVMLNDTVQCVKISNTPPASIHSFIGGKVKVNSYDEDPYETIITEDFIFGDDLESYAIIGESCFVVFSDEVTQNGVTLTHGVWSVDLSAIDDSIQSFAISTPVKKIDPSVLPNINGSNLICGDAYVFNTSYAYDEVLEIVEGTETMKLIKVSDNAPDKLDFIGGTYGMVLQGSIIEQGIEGLDGHMRIHMEETITEDMLKDTSYGMYAIQPFGFVVTDSEFSMDGYTLTRGVWMLDFAAYSGIPEEVEFSSYFTTNTFKPINDIYLPKDLVREKDIIKSWNDLTDRPFGENVYYFSSDNTYEDTVTDEDNTYYKITDTTIAMNDVLGATLKLSGWLPINGPFVEETASITITPEIIVGQNEHYYTIMSMVYVIMDEEYTIPDTELTFTRGIWVGAANEADNVYISLSKPTFTTQLDEKYIPDNIPKVGVAKVGQTIVVKAIDANGKPIEWECVDMAAGGGSGAGLPAVTEADNGKILMVVDGVWAAVALPNAEEASF